MGSSRHRCSKVYNLSGSVLFFFFFFFLYFNLFKLDETRTKYYYYLPTDDTKARKVI